MEQVNRDIRYLRAFAAKIEPNRKLSALLDDMYEAADDWANFGEVLIENSDKTDFPARTQQEIDRLRSLTRFYRDELTENDEFAPILQIGQRLVEHGRERKLNPDGYLGAVRIIRKKFSFLEHEFGFCCKKCQLSEAEYVADHLAIALDLPSEYGSWCWIKTLGNEPDSFQVETLLFQAGHPEILVLPPGVAITTEAQVESWFTKIAAILCEHGSDLLANKPGALERLKAASVERERLYVKECERLWRLEHPGEPLPTVPSQPSVAAANVNDERDPAVARGRRRVR